MPSGHVEAVAEAPPAYLCSGSDMHRVSTRIQCLTASMLCCNAVGRIEPGATKIACRCHSHLAGCCCAAGGSWAGQAGAAAGQLRRAVAQRAAVWRHRQRRTGRLRSHAAQQPRLRLREERRRHTHGEDSSGPHPHGHHGFFDMNAMIN